MITAMSERDVVFTPFMLRVREALAGSRDETVVLHCQTSRLTSIAIAVDEWFMLRARAEHVMAEANAMLDPDLARIQLDDEYGTGELAFVLRWSSRSWRIVIHENVANRTARVELEGATQTAHPLKPVDQAFLEDLIISLLDLRPARIAVHGETASPSIQRETP